MRTGKQPIPALSDSMSAAAAERGDRRAEQGSEMRLVRHALSPGAGIDADPRDNGPGNGSRYRSPGDDDIALISASPTRCDRARRSHSQLPCDPGQLAVPLTFPFPDLGQQAIFTARSRSSSGYFRCAAMSLHPPRFHGLQDSRGGPGR